MAGKRMLLKVGDKLFNVDHLVHAEYTEGDAPALSLYLVNVYAGNERRTTELKFTEDEARETWKVLTAEARDVMRKLGTGEVDFRS